MRLEGDGFSKLAQAIRDIGYNKDIDIELATVTAPPPNLKIKIDGMSIELEKSDLIVAERLTTHTCNVSLASSNVSLDMVAAGTGPHTHGVNGVNINGTITFTDVLKPGDRVIVASINNGQTYVVLDKAVIY